LKRVVIIDTWGVQPLNETFMAALPHVTFRGHSPAEWQNQPAHPHGGWCAWDWLAQESDPVEGHLIQFLGPDGNGGRARLDDWLFGTLTDLKLRVGDGVNCSWGSDGPGRFDPRWADRFAAAAGGATIFWAAGNSGRGARSWPQVHTRKFPGHYVVGAIDRRGFRAEFSSAVDTEEYVHMAGLGVGGMSLDPITGKITPWTGTSKSSPGVGGSMSSLGVYGRDVLPFARAYACADDDGDGVPNGIHASWRDRVAAGELHPEVGGGVVEGLRQQRLRDTGRALGSWVAGVNGMALDMEGVRGDIAPVWPGD
jgi:subtilisin family serine protease